MTPILGILASGISGNLWQPGKDFDSIATTTVGGAGASSITFSSIPSTYRHLQIRLMGRSTSSTADGNYVSAQFNSDTAANYSYHALSGDGSSAAAAGLASQTAIYLQRLSSDAMNASAYGVIVTDILDYTSANKNKTVRSLGGFDTNGGTASTGKIYFTSGAWLNSSTAISSIVLTPDTGNFKQYTSAALYGIK
jgi:hypothetical protein